jgi:DNA-binding response OmpR family regulator
MKSILVIDDNADLRDNTAEILTLAGYKTFVAEDGKKGVDMAIKEKPDLVVCDIMMPVLDGYGVLHLLRRNTETAHIPFLFLTAKSERADFRKGMEMGADDYLTKPFDDIELLNAIEVRLKREDIYRSRYVPNGEGVSRFVKDAKENGRFLSLSEKYDSETISKKQVIYQEGRHPRYLYYILSGKVKCSKINEDGKEYITDILVTGDFIGFTAVVEEKAYEDTATVLEDAELLLIPREDFISMIREDMRLATSFIGMMSQSMKEKEERLVNLAYGSLRKRVALGLVELHKKYNTGTEANPIDISRDDLARYIGTATESLIRTLSDFKSEGHIEIKQGKVYVLQVAALQNLIA